MFALSGAGLSKGKIGVRTVYIAVAYLKEKPIVNVLKSRNMNVYVVNDRVISIKSIILKLAKLKIPVETVVDSAEKQLQG